MRKLLIPLVVGVAILVSQVVTGVSAQTPNDVYGEVSVSYEPFTTPPSVEPTVVDPIDGCWDCAGSTMTEAEVVAAVCSPAFLEKNPQMLDECFPDKWEWVCFPEGNCEMYRRDLDPLGIFATPTPEPTPTVVPTPEATGTVVAP